MIGDDVGLIDREVISYVKETPSPQAGFVRSYSSKEHKCIL